MSAERPDFTPADIIREGGLVERGRTDAERRTDAFQSIKESLCAHINFGLEEPVREGQSGPPYSAHVPSRHPMPEKILHFRGDWPGPFNRDIHRNELISDDIAETAFFMLEGKRHPDTNVPKLVLRFKEINAEGKQIYGRGMNKLKIRGVDLDDPSISTCNEQLMNLDTTTLLRLARLLDPDRTQPITAGEYHYPGGPLNRSGRSDGQAWLGSRFGKRGKRK